MEGILLRYNEIALKGKNRGWFEHCLEKNAKQMLKAAQPNELISSKRVHGRVLIRAPWNETTKNVLQRTFGMMSFSRVRIVPTEIETVYRSATENFIARVEEEGLPRSFRVRTSRSDKVISQNSMEIDREVGDRIIKKYPNLKVDLKNAEATVGIEIRKDHSYIWSSKEDGPAGLPVGSNSRLLTLISGGLDSPVAAIRLLKRGCSSAFLHFHGAPYVGDDALNKVEDLTRIIQKFSPRVEPLISIRFGGIQKAIAEKVKPRFRTIIYRRLMFRVAEKIASKMGIRAIATGESLAQVASQTVENMAAIDRVVAIPVFRPLLAMDKQEIVDLAQKLGTFETSIVPAADCCTLFADQHPELRGRMDRIEEEESKLDIDDLVQESLTLMTIQKIKNGRLTEVSRLE